MLIVAALSGQDAARRWACEHLQARYGPVVLQSPVFDFVETQYYEAEMGADLRKQFFAFERLIDPALLVDIKLDTNRLECEYAAKLGAAVPRPLNLDPGYLNLGKWVLATTKDQAHRLYLGRGIFAEVTLSYSHGEWRPWPWTYPNYRRDDYRVFFADARTAYARLLRGREQVG
jgi:hypothetical protein